jgi:hypothetical protein
MVLAALFALAGQAAQPVPIWVGPQIKQEFADVDQGVLDSIEDLKRALTRELKLRKTGSPYVLSTAEQAAKVRIYVLARGFGEPSGVGITTHVPGQVLKFPATGQTVEMPGTSIHTPIRKRYLTALLRANTYERPMTAEDVQYDTWKRVADLLARDVRAWLAANQEQLTRNHPK